jgi:ubiquinone/menaquinone biosynthesis C-methylase UbiE
MMDRKSYSEANRAAWNETAPKHEKEGFQRLLDACAKPGFCVLDATAVGMLTDIGLEGKDVAQLSCNNGRELLSMKSLGARRCTGFDISDEFMQQAERLKAASGLDCEFVRCDVYEIPESYNQGFDLVYLSVGTLGWMPDLAGFIAIVKRLLRPGGWLAIYEMHPILILFDEGTENPLDIVNSYFEKQPLVEETGLDYIGHSVYKSLPNYWFQHTLGDIFTQILQQGLHVRSFVEYAHDVSESFAYLEEVKPDLPLSFTLSAQMPV